MHRVNVNKDKNPAVILTIRSLTDKQGNKRRTETALRSRQVQELARYTKPNSRDRRHALAATRRAPGKNWFSIYDASSGSARGRISTAKRSPGRAIELVWDWRLAGHGLVRLKTVPGTTRPRSNSKNKLSRTTVSRRFGVARLGTKETRRTETESRAYARA